MEQYNRKPLKSFGQILSLQNYEKVAEGNEWTTKRKLVFAKKITESNDYCRVARDVKDAHICYIDNLNNDFIYYLHLVLDSAMGRLLVCSNAASNGIINGFTSIKSLKDFPVVVVPNDIQKAASRLDQTIRAILEIFREKEDVQFIESARNFMFELRDDFVFELYAKELFETNGIDIVNSLVRIIEDSEDRELLALAPKMLESVTNPDSALLSNMRRFRVLIGNIVNNIDK